MDTQILQATTLARMGLNDAQIAQVLRIGASEHVVAQQRPAPAVMRRAAQTSAPRSKRYDPLLAAMRADVVRAGGSVVATLRTMTSQHEALLKAAAPNPENQASLRGLASLVGNARTRWGGVVGGMRFTATGDVSDHQTNYVYRIEAV